MSEQTPNEWIGELLRAPREKKPPWSVGDKYRRGNTILEVRAIVDDQVVFRRWSKKKNDWVYYVHSVWLQEPGEYVLKVKK